MPFTFAHPAIVLPFYKWRSLSFTALVFGSMAPDFEYFIRMRAYSVHSHTISGLFWFDLPMTLALSFLFHFIVKRQMIACLPTFLQSGLYSIAVTPWRLQTWREWVVFAYSAILGSFTHLAWDAYTHDGAFAVVRLSVLQQPLSFAGKVIPVYKLLQHGSTCIGFASIACFLWKTKQSGENVTVSETASIGVKAMYWAGVVLTGVLFALAFGGAWQITLLLQKVVPFLSGSLAGLVVMSFAASRIGLKK